MLSSFLDEASAELNGWSCQVSAPSDKPPGAAEDERHFVVCKKPLALGEPRACEMATYEECEV